VKKRQWTTWKLLHTQQVFIVKNKDDSKQVYKDKGESEEMYNFIPVCQMKCEQDIQKDTVIELKTILAELGSICWDHYLVNVERNQIVNNWVYSS